MSPTTRRDSSPLLTAAEAAEYLRVSHKTLEAWRATGMSGLVYRRVGRRRVFYHRADLDDYLENCRYLSTSQYPANSRTGK